jgi:hypothetical protein
MKLENAGVKEIQSLDKKAAGGEKSGATNGAGLH